MRLGSVGVFPVDIPGQLNRLGAPTPFRIQELHLGKAAVLLPMLRLPVFKAGGAVRVDAAKEIFIPVQTIQAFREPVAHVPIKAGVQLQNGQKALIIIR